MQTLQEFDNANFGSVRVILVDDAPWFVGKDVTNILGYRNSRKAIIDHVDDEDKGVTKCDTPGGAQELTIINESGLYSLILSSKMPSAKDFKRWVTSDVLPQIRKTGQYAPAPATLEQRVLLIIQELHDRVEEQKKQITMMTPGYDYASQVLLSDSTYNISQIAADYGMSAIRMNQLLAGYGVQHKSGDQWILNTKYANMGYVTSRTEMYGPNKTHSKMRTVWTERGRAWIYKSLKNYNILPRSISQFANIPVDDKELF